MSGRKRSWTSFSRGRSPGIFIRDLALFLALGLLVAACARTLPVYNVTDAPVITASGQSPSLDQVRGAIVTACRAKGWIVDARQEGHITATANVRKHIAVVDIFYSAQRYTISYKDSEVLLYDGEKIHRNYNKWILLLEQKINAELEML
jgi:hypothetical protein